MRRTFAVIGFTVFLTATALCAFGLRTAQIALPVLAVLSAVCLAVRRLRREPVLVCSLLSATAACILFLTAMYTQFMPVHSMNGATAMITARMAELPRESGGRTILALQTDAVDGVPMQCNMLFMSEDAPDVSPTDYLTFSAKLYASDDPTGETWLRIYDMADLTVTPGKSSLRSRIISVRGFVKRTLAQTLPETPGAVLTAMLLGDRNAIPNDVLASMTRSGITHIFSVSGFHLSVFALTLLHALERRRLPRGVCELLCAALILFVMAITGFPRSCVRAGLMLLVMLLGRIFERRADALNSLGLALLLMSGTNPFCTGDTGLQLSVLGTLGVVCGMPYVERLVSKIRLPFYPLQSALQAVLSTMLISSIITLLTLPVAVLNFETVSVVAPLTNACMLWAAEWAMTLAAVALPFALWAPLQVVFHPLCIAAGLLARYCVAVARFFGGLSFAALRVGDPDEVHWIAGTMLLIAAALVLRIPMRRKIAMVTALSVFLMGFFGVWHGISTRNVAEIEALGVGNGTAILVKSRGRTAMIGCGGDHTARIAASETDRLDWLLLPRVQKTETACASELLRRMRVDTVVIPEKSPALFPVFFVCEPKIFSGGTLQVGDVQAEYLPLSASSVVRLHVYDRTVLMIFSPGCDLSLLPREWLSSDVLIVRGDVPPAIQPEKYVCVLVQGEEPFVSNVVHDIRAHGGDAVSNGVISIQKGGFIGERVR